MLTAIKRPASARSTTSGAGTLQTVGHGVLRHGAVFLLIILFGAAVWAAGESLV